VTEEHKKSKTLWKSKLGNATERFNSVGNEQKQQRSRTRRSEILKAAVHVFAREGIAGARIADIAAQAGVPVSSVYDYFTDKEAVANALPVAHMTQFFQEFSDAAEKKSSAMERLRLYLWLTVDFARRHPEWARTLYLEIWPSVVMEKAELRASFDDFSQILIELIHDGERLGEWSKDPAPYQTATIFTGAITQSIVTWLLYHNPRDIMKATGSLIDRLLLLLNTEKAKSVKKLATRS
jgi:AcrR family transcriptional regulator